MPSGPRLPIAALSVPKTFSPVVSAPGDKYRATGASPIIDLRAIARSLGGGRTNFTSRGPRKS